MTSQPVIKIGAVIASIGTISLIIFTITLLVFPIVKKCISESQCNYMSQAPYPLNFLINPIVLVTTLIIIAGGIALIRFGRWYFNRKYLNKNLK